MISCAECGHENMDGLEYCDACGGKLPTSVQDAVQPAAAPIEVAPESPASAEAESTEVSAPVATEANESEPPVEKPEQPVAAPTVTIQQAKLTVTRGGTIGKEFPLQEGDNLVGRWDPDSGAFPEVDMENDDPEARISRKHALIRVGDTVTIEDIGSLNGTFVNRGARLEPGAPVTLNDGDEVIIGKTFFKLSLS